MQRSLNVWIDQRQVGRLRELNGLWAFRYEPQWLNSPAAHPLCPTLPLQAQEHQDGATHRPVQWYFDNLLPEEGQRQLIAKAAGAAIEDAFTLLQHFGAESAGSLTLLPPDRKPEPGTTLALSYAELSKRIQAMPRIPLAEQAAKKMSLAGAQHKVAVIYRNGQLFEPVGSEASTHILKPDHPDEAWPHSVINEWFVMTLAGRVGLPVPEVHRIYVPEPVFLIERFDRRKTSSGWERLHCIDACQLEGLSREFKYSAGNIERLAGLASRCQPALLARQYLFQWLVFNTLVGNEDAHLKNLSFLLPGSKVGLAPFYDLLCTAVYGTQAYGQDRWPAQANLAWPVHGVQHLASITLTLLIEAGTTMGIKPVTSRSIVRRLIDSVRQEATRLLDETLQRNEALRQARPELGATLAGEARLLRSIHAIAIKEMSLRLEKGL
ncbi:HipA domain-containing protein [Pseudomonas sp. DTU_2021_1001937_2_SI_NGA_ILE_001]|uniref:HipA domain-containing protein n=1 Tax=Pseudomonas sp. DTU_2021_1001937_2_SI_NGA_ILE_001 TaxID=3077589 RepID=UPI0028FC1CEC|nr:HipA domain-containing protein [Pseudomonas sp. DTU_2021_1001937_2_SI_NGA_ILE_001]WNW12420.1 HipA domain-containing protein [Pseudomonas sp. DTU_2021_1001937_2_SI_NGA_ILE_001]